MLGITTLFRPTAPYSALSSFLYERYIAEAIRKQNELLMEGVFCVDRLPEDAKILDAGCGSASLLHDLSKRHPGFELTGIDRSQEQVLRAVARLKGVAQAKVLRADAEKLPFPDASFDFVFSIGVIKHIVNKRRMLEECARVLKPRGRMFIMEADREATQDRISYFVNDTQFPAPVKKIWMRLFKRHVIGKSLNIPEAKNLVDGLSVERIRVEVTPRVPAFMIIGENGDV